MFNESIKYIIGIIILICSGMFILSFISIFILLIIYKIHLIKYSIKNRNFKEMKLSTKISEFLDAIFYEPYKNSYLRDSFKVTFKTNEEYSFNSKIWKYIQNLFYLVMVLAILMIILMLILEYFDLGFKIGSK